MRSIERYLLGWLLGALSLGLLLIALVSYLVTLDEMNEVMDADLRNVAMALASFQGVQLVPPAVAASGAEAPRPAAPGSDGSANAHAHAHANANGDGNGDGNGDDDEAIVTLIWAASGERLYASDASVTLPFSRVEGLVHTQVAGEEWVVYTLVGAQRVVQAAQRLAGRREMASESATTVLLPMLLLLVLTGALLVYALRRGLQPLDDTASAVALRSEKSLDAIATAEVPREILPLVQSVNALMQRLARALAAQGRFLADAAHELRTPATALRLQLQLLERAPDEAARSQALHALRAGINRTQRLIEQLLVVARTGADGEPMQREPVALDALVKSVVASMSAKADHRGIDLGAQTSDQPVVDADAQQLTVLLNNLVENALRYTPEGGVVDVQALVLPEGPALRVQDNGPGIAAHERQRVFDRFYRGERPDAGMSADEGSGLGLAIVQAIAERHGATVRLAEASPVGGLLVTVLFSGVSARGLP